jgi:excisionase family DNA binding protein
MRSPRDVQRTERSTGIVSEAPLLETVAGACRILQCSRPTLYRLLHDGTIRSLKVGKLRRIPVSELEEFVARGLVAGRG